MPGRRASRQGDKTNLNAKHENNLHFNQIIDDYYESNDTRTSDEAWWKDQGIELAAGIEYTIIQ